MKSKEESRHLGLWHRIGVYRIRNLVNGKSYIGSTVVSFGYRWSAHKFSMTHDVSGNPIMQDDCLKFGLGAFVFEVLQDCHPNQCIRYEQIWIDEMRPEYNIDPTAGSPLGRQRSQASRALMSKIMTGKKRAPWVVEEMRIRATGRKASEATKAKMSIAHLGNRSNLGRSLPDDQRARISAGLRRFHLTNPNTI